MQEKILQPVLLGRKEKIHKIISDCNFTHLKNIKIIFPPEDPLLDEYSETFYNMKRDKGMSQEQARELLSQNNYFASMAVHKGAGDGLLTGVTDSFLNSVLPPLRILGSGKRGTVAGVNLALFKNRVLFFADTAFNINPTAEQLAHIAIYTAQVARYFYIEPRIAMLSFLNFSDGARGDSPAKMKEAVKLVKKWKPELKVEGEIQADIAVNAELASSLFPQKTFDKEANVLIFPNLDAGNMAYKLVQQLGPGEVLGPLLMGVKKPVNVVQRTCDVDDLINSLVLTSLKVHAYRNL